jgi:hypothetical protein
MGDTGTMRRLADSEPTKADELQAELRKICDPDLENQRAESFIQMQLAEIKARGLREQVPSEVPLARADPLEMHWRV